MTRHAGRIRTLQINQVGVRRRVDITRITEDKRQAGWEPVVRYEPVKEDWICYGDEPDTLAGDILTFQRDVTGDGNAMRADEV